MHRKSIALSATLFALGIGAAPAAASTDPVTGLVNQVATTVNGGAGGDGGAVHADGGDGVVVTNLVTILGGKH